MVLEKGRNLKSFLHYPSFKEMKLQRKGNSSRAALERNPSHRAAATACIDAVTFTSTCRMASDLYVPSSPEEEFEQRHVYVTYRSPALRSRSNGNTMGNLDRAHSKMERDSRSCSVCKLTFQTSGRPPPRKFPYSELKSATKNFAQNMFLAEGETSFVFKGVLEDGSTVAVKIGSEEDARFHTEIEVLSCVEHVNVVSLVGYCKEEGKSLLVYDFMCNGTLDWHLSGRNPNVLPWPDRKLIAVQLARGLQYLHENFQKGCIVHRDIRPENILVTHDFSLMIAGLGLATWIQRGEKTEKAVAVVGKPGYIAPEYAETGELTEKADVYSFGILLLELISGRKLVVDSNKPYGQCCLLEKERPLLEDFSRVVKDILDPRLRLQYNHYELYCMVTAACMCTRKDPLHRPNMQQVLCALEDAREVNFQNMSGHTPTTPHAIHTPNTPHARDHFSPRISPRI